MLELKLLEIQKKIEETYKKVCIESGEKLIKRFSEIEKFSSNEANWIRQGRTCSCRVFK